MYTGIFFNFQKNFPEFFWKKIKIYAEKINVIQLGGFHVICS